MEGKVTFSLNIDGCDYMSSDRIDPFVEAMKLAVAAEAGSDVNWEDVTVNLQPNKAVQIVITTPKESSARAIQSVLGSSSTLVDTIVMTLSQTAALNSTLTAENPITVSGITKPTVQAVYYGSAAAMHLQAARRKREAKELEEQQPAPVITFVMNLEYKDPTNYNQKTFINQAAKACKVENTRVEISSTKHTVEVGYSFRPGVTEDQVQVVIAAATGVSVDDVDVTRDASGWEEEDDQAPSSLLGTPNGSTVPEQTNYSVSITVKDAINSRYLKTQLLSLQPIKDSLRRQSVTAVVLSTKPAKSVMVVTFMVRANVGQAQAAIPNFQGVWSLGQGLGASAKLVSHFTDYAETIRISAGALKYELTAMEEGVKAWTDRRFIYRGVPMMFRDAILLRGPHFVPAGIKIKLFTAALRKVCIFVDVSNTQEDGGFPDSLPANWTVSAQYGLSYYSEAFRRTVSMTTWCKDIKGNVTLPATTNFVRLGIVVLHEKPVAPGSPYFPARLLPPGTVLPPGNDPRSQEMQAQLAAAKSAGEGPQVEKRLPDGTLVVRSAASAIVADQKAARAANSSGCNSTNGTSLLDCR
jgi:hypothetical protein